jgi:hypothetical protein
VGRWDQNGSYGDWLGGCGLDSTGSGQGPVAGCYECGDEPSGSCATELVSIYIYQFIVAGVTVRSLMTLAFHERCHTRIIQRIMINTG